MPMKITSIKIDIFLIICWYSVWRICGRNR